MYNMVLEKKIISKILIIILMGGCIWGSGYKYADEIIQSVASNINISDGAPSYEETSKEFLDSMPFKRMMLDFNGYIAKTLNMREIYQSNGGIVASNGYIVGTYPQTTTDYEFQQTLELKKYLDERGIQLLYVNEPTKYFDDTIIQKDFAKQTYVNANTDLFLSRLEEAGINYIDLRNTYTQMKLDSFSLFYKTDHHWTVPAGKIAAEEIAATLNENFGYHIDLTLYEDKNFTITHFDNAWLGEQGKKLGASFVGMDDYDLILPIYDTDYTITYENGDTYSGAFGEVFVSQEAYFSEENNDVYKCPSWHYSYMPTGLSQSTVINNTISDGKKILVLGDSFEYVTVPFLSLGVSEIQSLILRSYEGSLRDYIDAHDFDTIIIAYLSTNIHEHDNKESVNYTMFNFE